MKMKRFAIVFMTLGIIAGQMICSNAFAYQLSEIPNVLKGLRNNYDHWRSGLPLGDINRDGIGNALTTDRLIFSESVSYCLFSHVLPISGEDETTAKNNFLECWNWTKTNMVRKNISKVFRWETQTWEDMPQNLKDNLLAWRYVINTQKRHIVLKKIF